MTRIPQIRTIKSTDFVAKFGVTSSLRQSFVLVSAPLLGESGYDTHELTGRTP